AITALLGCRSNSSTNPITTPPIPSPSVKSETEKRLSNLRHKLDLVHEKELEGKNQPFQVETEDVSFLIGLKRDKIKGALGNPSVCEGISDESCKMINEWVYAFYYLPSGWNGGGPELLLKFDQSDKCVSAQWQKTQ
ncbi:MAG TPA: hypothetical protein VEF04_10720, partial [Blastocatellia bacterium]|nr:hypothetical protein [Blastocatellia bacterium]